MKKFKKQNGITLIALVITIIVMLILVGVSVTVALNGGLFTTANQAKENTATERDKELGLSDGKVEINNKEYNSIQEYVNGNEEEPGDDETLVAGLYAADGTFTPWATLISNGDLVVKDGELTGRVKDIELTFDNKEEVYTNIEGKLVIDNSVTSIAYRAFGYSAYSFGVSLTEVIIPDSVVSIGEEAFTNCGELTSINIPGGVESIGRYAFWYSGIKTVNISVGIESIEQGAFSECYSLTEINYTGTEEEWNNITIADDWNNSMGQAANTPINYNYVVE